MQKIFSVGLVIGALALGNGCSESVPVPSQQSGASRVSSPPSDPIALVVYDFLEAVRAGDSSSARQRLTPLAIQRMTELGMDLVLPVSETAEFNIGPAEMIEANLAVVDTLWTESDGAGKTQRDDLVVVLELCENRWCIKAIAAGMGANQQPDGVNFETPDQPFNFSNTASTNSSTNTVPQQATRSGVQDPFRQ